MHGSGTAFCTTNEGLESSKSLPVLKEEVEFGSELAISWLKKVCTCRRIQSQTCDPSLVVKTSRTSRPKEVHNGQQTGAIVRSISGSGPRKANLPFRCYVTWKGQHTGSGLKDVRLDHQSMFPYSSKTKLL